MTNNFLQVHARTVRLAMNFQKTPYCEDEEEIESFSRYQKFFVGMDFIVRKMSL